MGIEEEKCDICGEELNAENYYYIYTGRLQQGVMSDPKANTEYKMCNNCYARVKAELMASVQKHKMKSKEAKTD